MIHKENVQKGYQTSWFEAPNPLLLGSSFSSFLGLGPDPGKNLDAYSGI